VVLREQQAAQQKGKPQQPRGQPHRGAASPKGQPQATSGHNLNNLEPLCLALHSWSSS
jgi:hypothetical protein